MAARARPSPRHWGLLSNEVPACPGCGRVLQLTQPDEAIADRMIGACVNEQCRQWVLIGQREGRWLILDRVTSPAKAVASA